MIYHKEQFFYRRVAKAKKAGDAGRNSSQTKFVKTTGGGPGQAFLTEPDFEDLEEETASTGVSPLLTGMDPVMDMASVVSVPANSVFSSAQDSAPTGMTIVAPPMVGLQNVSRLATSKQGATIEHPVSSGGSNSEVVISTSSQSASGSGTGSQQRNRKRSRTPAPPSAVEEDLELTRKRILAIDQEARNEVHRQEALFWKVKREIMVAEALGRGIELPSSTRNNDGVAESRLLNGELDVILRNIAEPENVVIFVHISFLGLGITVF
jgi:hypothetical protein